MTTQTQSPATVRESIEQATRRWKEAFDREDADAAIQLYWEDALLLPPDGEPIQGAEGIRGFIEAYFEILISKDEMRTTEAGSLGEGAFEVGTYSGMHDIGGERVPDRGKYLRVWKQDEKGDWKIYREMFNSSAPQE